MNGPQIIASIILLIAANVWAAPQAERPKAAPAHHAPLAEHLARTEAHVRALDRHLSAAAERKTHRAADAKLVERARKIGRHHLHEPLVWNEYVRRLPGVVVVDNAAYRPEIVEVEAENAAAALGDDIGALWARRKQMQAERMILWSKIAFRAVAEMELSEHPLYRFELKSAGKPLDAQRMEALGAAVQFVRVVDHLANEAQEAVDSDPVSVYVQWHKILATARSQMQDKILLQALVAMDAYKPDTEAGQLTVRAKELADLAQTIVDSEQALATAEAADDDEEADASRAQLQTALADTAGAAAALDNAIQKAAAAWGINGIPGTKAAFGELPDLTVIPASAPPGEPVALSPETALPAAPVSAMPNAVAARTELAGGIAKSDPFEDVAPAGTILVGFDFTTKRIPGATIINSARPIYRGAGREFLGRQLGKPTGTATRVEARPGYGVVAIGVGTGLKHIQGIVIYFMRMNGNVVITSDAYDAPYGPKEGPGRRFGDNRAVIGVFGEAGSNLDKLGLILRN